MPPPDPPSTIEFLALDPARQRLQIRDEVHGLSTQFQVHCADPLAHSVDESRLKHEVRDKGPIIAILAAILIIVEALGLA